MTQKNEEKSWKLPVGSYDIQIDGLRRRVMTETGVDTVIDDTINFRDIKNFQDGYLKGMFAKIGDDPNPKYKVLFERGEVQNMKDLLATSFSVKDIEDLKVCYISVGDAGNKIVTIDVSKGKNKLVKEEYMAVKRDGAKKFVSARRCIANDFDDEGRMIRSTMEFENGKAVILSYQKGAVSHVSEIEKDEYGAKGYISINDPRSYTPKPAPVQQIEKPKAEPKPAPMPKPVEKTVVKVPVQKVEEVQKPVPVSAIPAEEKNVVVQPKETGTFKVESKGLALTPEALNDEITLNAGSKGKASPVLLTKSLQGHSATDIGFVVHGKWRAR